MSSQPTVLVLDSHASTYLKYAVYYLPPYILLVRSKQLALQESEDAFRNTKFRLQVLGWHEVNTFSLSTPQFAGLPYIYNS